MDKWCECVILKNVYIFVFMIVNGDEFCICIYVNMHIFYETCYKYGWFNYTDSWVVTCVVVLRFMFVIENRWIIIWD